jgi:uncharacterized protein YjbI with pentapeptide repeats
VALALGLAAFALPALAQQALPTRIWDVKLGTPLDALPTAFADPACGSAGGPPSTVLGSFANFAKCTVGADGLREIWFRYDDTLEDIARALRNPVQTARAQATAIGGSPIIVSFLADAAGIIRGYRIYSDPQADPRTRYDAHLLAATFMGLLGVPRAWTCTSDKPADGEAAIEGVFVKQSCTIDTGSVLGTATNRFFLKPGQTVVDPETGKPMVNAFESSASIEVMQKQPFPPALDLPPATPPQPAIPAGASDAVVAFLTGKSKDCPGCDLANIDLNRRDLSGANLSGAKLTTANFHRAILRGTNFANADLDSADFNATDISLANFTGASLNTALFYQARGTKPVFDGADLSGAKLGSTDLRQSSFAKAKMLAIDLGQARLNDANLSGTALSGSYLFQTSLIRADLSGAMADKSNFVEAVLRDGNLSHGTFTDSDFQKANLQSADLTGANMTHVRLQYATLRDAKQEGTILTNSMLPDGSMHP